MPTIINPSLNAKIENVNNYIKNNYDSTAFIYFKVNNFVLDTRKIDSRDHYAISLKNQKTGVGSGNQFTIKIIYHMDFDNNYKTAIELEGALSSLRDITELLNPENVSALQDANRNKCELQYGYLQESKIKATDMYYGRLLKYEVNVNKQILEYTLQGYTSEQATIGTVNWYPAVVGADDFPNVRTGTTSKLAKLRYRIENDEELTPEEIEDYITDFDEVYTGALYYNPYKALKCFIADYNRDIKRANTDRNIYPTTFTIIDDSGLLDKGEPTTGDEVPGGDDLQPVRLSLCRGQTPIEYVEYLISMFKMKEKDTVLEHYKKQYGIVDRWVYEFKYSTNVDNEIEIHINKISSENQDTYTYRFDGYSPDNNLLINYNLTYDGTVALTVADTMSNGDDKNAIYIRSDGLISAEASITNDMFVEGAIDDILVSKQNTWLDRISCANNCTMTTFGMPFEIPVGTIFQVNMLIGTSYYHSSGNCYVTGIVDNIENNSFTTNFTMIRLPGKGDVV